MTLELRVFAYCNRSYNERVHAFTNALNGLLCSAAAWTQLKNPLLTQLSSSFITVHAVLHLQKLTDTNGHRTTKANNKFKSRRFSIWNDNSSLYVNQLQLVLTRKLVKSDKSGVVSLGKKEDTGSWIRIHPASSGKYFSKVMTSSCILH